MRAVVQRVSQAGVTVQGRNVGAIDEPGLLVLVGVTHDDTPDLAAKLAAKLWGLRILDGEKSCSDIGAPLLVISQFTLYADLAKGRRPSWSAAAPAPPAPPWDRPASPPPPAGAGAPPPSGPPAAPGPVAEPLVAAVVQAL